METFTTKRDAVAQWLRDSISRGEYGPGQPLQQQAIAARLNVSPTPVREALRLLEAEGLIAAISHHGATVRRLSAADVREIYLIRQQLEGLATRAAVLRDAATRQALIRDLAAIQSEIDGALAQKNNATFPALNRQFHFRLYEASDLPLLIDMIRRLWFRLPAFWLRTIPGRAQHMAAFHAPIIAAVEAGDADSAAKAVQHHIAVAAETLVEHLTLNPSFEHEGAPLEAASGAP